MILIGLRTGLRQGELLALRWEDVDLKTGLLRVRQSVTRGHVTEPKSGKGRDVPLSDDAVAAFKTQRHLRGPLVFCDQDGTMLVKTECKWPLWRACQRAGLRRISWHVLRHSFASHLAMRGVPLKVVQELLGHATMDMTMRYAHLSPNIPREAVKALDAGAVAPTWHRRSNLSDNAGQVVGIEAEKRVEAPGVESRPAISVSIGLDRFRMVLPSLRRRLSQNRYASRSASLRLAVER